MYCIQYVAVVTSTLYFLYTANIFGLFRPDEEPTKGEWLEQEQTLDYYGLKSDVRLCDCNKYSSICGQPCAWYVVIYVVTELAACIYNSAMVTQQVHKYFSRPS